MKQLLILFQAWKLSHSVQSFSTCKKKNDILLNQYDCANKVHLRFHHLIEFLYPAALHGIPIHGIPDATAKSLSEWALSAGSRSTQLNGKHWQFKPNDLGSIPGKDILSHLDRKIQFVKSIIVYLSSDWSFF